MRGFPVDKLKYNQIKFKNYINDQQDIDKSALRVFV